MPPSVADRITFWQRLHERFGKLSNRVGAATQTKVLGEIHARVPMVTADEQGALQLENAEADQRFWERLRDLHQSTADDHKGLAAKAERTAANGQAAADAAAANAAGAKDRVDRIKGGENVPGGLRKPMTRGDWIKQLGLTRRDLRRMEHLMAVGKLGDDAWEEYSREHLRELMKADNRMTLAAAREVLRRRFPEAPEDKQAAHGKPSWHSMTTRQLTRASRRLPLVTGMRPTRTSLGGCVQWGCRANHITRAAATRLNPRHSSPTL